MNHIKLRIYWKIWIKYIKKKLQNNKINNIIFSFCLYNILIISSIRAIMNLIFFSKILIIYSFYIYNNIIKKKIINFFSILSFIFLNWRQKEYLDIKNKIFKKKWKNVLFNILNLLINFIILNNEFFSSISGLINSNSIILN
jgi:hypothetical protein